MSKKRICHMTSAHPQEDIRIFHKECVSLANNGYDVFLVSCGRTYDKNGVHIIGVEDKRKSRLGRILKTSNHIYRKALDINADIYHFHDPELLPYGLKLRKKGKIVIFDSHEDVSGQILDKYWIPSIIRRLVSSIYKKYESFVVKKLNAVVTATPHIADLFSYKTNKIVNVNNYAKLDDIVFSNRSFSQRDRIVCFAGGINEIRGESVMLKAMETVNGKLILAGSVEKPSINNTLENVSYIGVQPRKKVNELYENSRAGIIVYQPAKNHLESQPIKMFEYMAAGIPCVASFFPLWRQIVEDNNCGICIDPTNPSKLAEACNFLLDNPEKAQEMGKNGRKAVELKFNWNIEEKKLIELYRELSVEII